MRRLWRHVIGLDSGLRQNDECRDAMHNVSQQFITSSYSVYRRLKLPPGSVLHPLSSVLCPPSSGPQTVQELIEKPETVLRIDKLMADPQFITTFQFI